MNFQEPLSGVLERIAGALERLGPGKPSRPDFDAAEAFVWQPETESFQPISDVNRVPLSLLKGIDRMRDTLFANTLRFARGLPANNALLAVSEAVLRDEALAWARARGSRSGRVAWQYIQDLAGRLGTRL